MDKELSITLVEKNIVGKGTKVLATIKKIGISGNTVIKDTNLIIASIEGDLFHCFIPETKQEVDIVCSQILSIDGMVPKRLGGIFSINPDGTIRAPGKKRGRKPKK